MGKLKVGDSAPDFKGTLQDGREVTLSDYSDKKLILYFYPKDSTPGCTAQACSLRDGREELKNLGFEVLGVSPDSIKRHLNFIEKQNLNFDLVADEDHSIAEKYGVWALKKMMGKEYMGIVRTTFIIEDGKITNIFDKVKTKVHFEQILESLQL
ncbi:MAG: thioredoxin-dependent thiol peroxidase [Rikenellaceae bacterium]